MFSSLRGFFDRHRRKLIVATAAAGAAAAALAYARRRLREWEERETRTFLDATRKSQHFDSTEKLCDATARHLADSLEASVADAFDASRVLAALENTRRDDRVALWDRLKAVTFARASALIYAHSILVVALRIQLNVIGGYTYRDKHGAGPDAELKEKYLSLCRYFISEGAKRLCRTIEAKVGVVVDRVSLKQKLSLKDVEQLFWSIQAALCTDNSDPIKQIVTYFVGDDEKADDDPTFRTMLNETVDLLESDEVARLSISCVSRGFSTFFDQIAERMSCENESSSFVNIRNVQLPLIKLIPIVDSLTRPVDATNGTLSLAIVDQLIRNEKLKLLGANVYEVFCN